VLIPEFYAARYMDNDINPTGEPREIFHTQAEIFLSEFTCNAFNLIHAELPEIGRAIIFEPIKDGGHGNLIVKALPGRRIPIVSPDHQDDLFDIRYLTNHFFDDNFP
jgi:hypothetical protein